MTRWTQLRRTLPAGTLLAVGLVLAGSPGPARASLIFDPAGDILPTYTGDGAPGHGRDGPRGPPRGGPDDLLRPHGRPDRADARRSAGYTSSGWTAARARPASSARRRPPVIGPNVLWDLIVRINPDGTGLCQQPLAGVVTPLDPADIRISGNEFTASVPLSMLLPAATRPPSEWTYNLWPRNGIGQNVQVSDLAPDDGNSPVQTVPEPTSLTLCGIGALGLLGYAWRRSRHTASES